MMTRRVLELAFSWGVAALLCVLSIATYRAPKALPVSAEPALFSAQRALVHVERIAAVPHAVGTPEHETAKQYILGVLRASGLTPEIQNATGITTVANIVVATRVSNILVRIPGSASTGAVLLASHYDSVYTTPGAADDAAGVASLLETLRALRSGPPLKNDILILLTDGEEHSMTGAEAYVSAHSQTGAGGLIHVPVRIVLNFDNRGDRGPVNMFETSTGNSPLIDALARTPFPVASSLMYTAYLAIPNNTDFTVFKQSGLPGMNFAAVSGFQSYHTALDTVANLDPDTVQQIGSYASALATYFGNRDWAEAAPPSRDAVYFNLLGYMFVHYSIAWTWLLEVLATFFLLLLLSIGWRRRTLRLGLVLAGVCLVLLATALTGLGIALLAGVLQRFLGDRLLAGESLSNNLLHLGLVTAGLILAYLLRALCRRLIGLTNLRVSALCFFWLVSVLLTIRVPAVSYVYLIPALAAAATLFLVAVIPALSAKPLLRALCDAASSALAWILFAPLVYLLFILLGMTPVVGFAVGFIIAPLVFVLAEHDGSPSPMEAWPLGATITAVAVAAILLFAGLHDARFTPEHPRVDSIAYATNPVEGKSAWVSFDARTDDWTARFLGRNPQSGMRADLLGELLGPVLYSAAPLLSQGGAEAHVISDSTATGERTLQLNVHPQVPGDRVQLSWASDCLLKDLVIDGRVVNLAVGNDSPGNVGLQQTPRRVELFGVPAEGMAVSLRFCAAGLHRLDLLEYVPGFDRVPGFPGSAARPDNYIPVLGSDVTYVLRSLSL